ncbi:MAG: hypothetical protein ACK41Y_16355, partial [Paracoccus hibiscisoli]|uniref:hypothetical protein n=1 Tax=Paracoccus hibiscisoli TaxID=2023261 RepID=UPI00391B4D15
MATLTRFQAVLRGRATRQRLARARVLREAAIVIQAAWRRVAASRAVVLTRKRTLAAVRIQSMYRANRARAQADVARRRRDRMLRQLVLTRPIERGAWGDSDAGGDCSSSSSSSSSSSDSEGGRGGDGHGAAKQRKRGSRRGSVGSGSGGSGSGRESDDTDVHEVTDAHALWTVSERTESPTRPTSASATVSATQRRARAARHKPPPPEQQQLAPRQRPSQQPSLAVVPHVPPRLSQASRSKS